MTLTGGPTHASARGPPPLRGVSLTGAEAGRLAESARDNPDAASLLARLTPAKPDPVAGTKAPADESLSDWLARLEGPARPGHGQAGVLPTEGAGLLPVPPGRRPRRPRGRTFPRRAQR